MLGAVGGFSVGALVLVPFYARSLDRAMGFTAGAFFAAVWVGLAATAAMMCVVVPLRTQIGGFSSVLQSILLVLVGAAAYAIFAILFGGRRIASDFAELRRRERNAGQPDPAEWQFLPAPSETQSLS